MAQGAHLKKPVSASKPSKPNGNGGKTKKGARVAKSKKASNADRLQKKYSAGLVAKTEKLLGERAGHLEMLGKGRTGKGGKDGKPEEKKGGGSRKFVALGSSFLSLPTLQSTGKKRCSWV
ncbi:hypothetical protein BX600DRAFT_510012 [Xylariales sp. PMI_506]|nr:hypothetical protein BX600DRAFT_510012 [Xylariales sp. PMI_506]